MIRTVITKTPLRLPLGGGGTDLPAYVKEHGGFIFGVSLNKYVYVTVTHSSLFDDVTFSSAQDDRNEMRFDSGQLENVLAREALELVGLKNGLVISTTSDVPYSTGLGSSGALLVGLLHALYTLKSEKVTLEFLADRASHIFLERLKSSEGKQDSYLASLGGFSCFELDRKNNVTLLSVAISSETARDFEARSLYFYTGVQRRSGSILDTHQKKVASGDEAVINYRHRVKEIGREIKAAFKRGDLDRFGTLMHDHWQAKKGSTHDISTGVIDTLYERARAAGMLGGKILGAGGGGFFMAFAKKNSVEDVRRIFVEAGLKEVSMKIDEEGTTKLFDSLTG